MQEKIQGRIGKVSRRTIVTLWMSHQASISNLNTRNIWQWSLCEELAPQLISKASVRDFEPRPSVTSYVGDQKPKDDKSFVRDFEPNVSAYADDVKPARENSYTKDFEPRPNISAYTDDVKLADENSYTKDFEPRPNVSANTNDAKPTHEKSYTKDFGPRHNISANNDDVVGLKVETALSAFAE
ncbi:hypothetical protein ACS0TY_001728 [Phlomoides rotata]